jgi:hypothetical protein
VHYYQLEVVTHKDVNDAHSSVFIDILITRILWEIDLDQGLSMHCTVVIKKNVKFTSPKLPIKIRKIFMYTN